MREQVGQSKKATTSFSIPRLKQPTRGFGLESLETVPQATTEVESVNPILTHDIRRISLRPQAKLSISQPGDFYEQQADSVAQPEEEEQLQAKSISDTIQREEVAPFEEELQMSPMLQRQGQGGMAATPDLETSINQARGGGMPLAENLQRSMGKAMGADFSGVKVHTDSQSDQLNQSIQARAFTTGQDVFFRQGEYNPGSRGGQELLAHELTHVVQQNENHLSKSSLPHTFNISSISQSTIQGVFSNPESLNDHFNKHVTTKNDAGALTQTQQPTRLPLMR